MVLWILFYLIFFSLLNYNRDLSTLAIVYSLHTEHNLFYLDIFYSLQILFFLLIYNIKRCVSLLLALSSSILFQCSTSLVLCFLLILFVSVVVVVGGLYSNVMYDRVGNECAMVYYKFYRVRFCIFGCDMYYNSNNSTTYLRPNC